MKLDINRFIAISNIAMSQLEAENVEKKIEAIIDYVAMIKNVSCSQKALSLYQQDHRKNIFNSNIQSYDFNYHTIINNAPKKIENLFVVPDLITRKA